MTKLYLTKFNPLNILKNRGWIVLKAVRHKLDAEDESELKILRSGAGGDFVACIYKAIKEF